MWFRPNAEIGLLTIAANNDRQRTTSVIKHSSRNARMHFIVFEVLRFADEGGRSEIRVPTIELQ